MSSAPRPSGLTLQIQVDDLAQAREFFGHLFGAGPEFEPHEDFLEWRVGDAETWLQVVAVSPGCARPLANRVRLRVDDLDAARAALSGRGTCVSAVTTLPGVVRWVDFADPWGNALGLYQDLAVPAEATAPGGSVHDPSQFATE